MKESLFDIFSKHTNWEDLNNGERYIEMKQAANIYGDSLLSLGDRWIKAVEYDIEEISTMEPPHTHFNKDRQTNYRISVFDFLLIIRNALESHGFVINELDHVTQWKLGVKGKGIQIEDGLSRDEAGRLYNKLKKQGFRVCYYRELCSNLYTVIAYKGKTKNKIPTMEQQKRGNYHTEIPHSKPQATIQTLDNKTPFEELKEEWGKGKARLIIIRLEEKGIITANGDVYIWKINNEHGYSKSLYAYFVYKASEKLGWREGKNKDRIPWKKFNPLFPNVSENQNSRNADLTNIKKEKSIPSLAYVIDGILNWKS